LTSCSALIGLTRSYGASLINEGIRLSAVCPSIVKTNISSEQFYSILGDDLTTPMETIIEAFDKLLSSDESGLTLEAGAGGIVRREAVDYADDKVANGCKLLEDRAKLLITP
jgi:NAD(P)-dependent dehydrogenase (short-subunit alcohol dehydrogenase family)